MKRYRSNRMSLAMCLGVLFVLLPATSGFIARADDVDPGTGPAPADAPANVVDPEEATGATANGQTVPAAIRTLMQDRKYAAAVQAIDKAVAASQGPADYLGYLKGRALLLDKKYDDAIAAVAKTHPDSKWSRRARFTKGVALARKGDYRAAELVYRTEAEFLLSLDRKQEIADIYLEFADAFFKPPQEDTKPDYQKALEFYKQALDVGPKPEKGIEIELLIAQCHQNLGNHSKAVELDQAFIKDHQDHQLVIEARFRLGECYLSSKKHVAARRTWQDLLSIHEGSKSPRMAEAAYKLSLTYGIPSPQNKEDLELGVAALKSFVAAYPDHKLAAEAHRNVARSYQNSGRFEDAVESLKAFLADQRYAKSDEVPAARHQLGQCYQAQKKFDDALATWRDYLTKHPTHQAWSEVQQEIINVEFLKAQEAFGEKEYDDARRLWGEFLVKYPLDARSRSILYRFGQMEYLNEQWDAAIVQWRRLVSKYPNTNESSQAQYTIGVTLEEKLGKLEEALEEYKKVTWGSHAARAKQRIARLTAKQMKLATERVFRTDERPTLKLTTRNIEKVTVRQYTVDLETYFRKMHLARGVEGLDIALIDPDKSFEFDVPDYARLQRIESELPVPLPAGADGKVPTSGVMAVTVSSKTFEATTLVIQSDLDVIVKSSRDEVFVFAQNMLTGKPWPQAQVLVSDGSQVFAEGTTGDDGVFQNTYEELKTAGDVRVFAVAGGSVASNVVNLSGVGVAQGLSRRGYIYTDRPAYRAGQMVHIRGVLRQVSDDTYTVARDKKYQVEVYDNRSRLVRHDEVTLNDFGSFQSHVLLPATAPQGAYRVVVHDNDKENYEGTFVVHEYQLEPVRIEIDTPRSVYYRGEEIEGTIKVSFYYGAPVAGREIRYQLSGGRTFTEKTDTNGEVTFKLPTRDFREAQPLPLQVTLPERNLNSGKTFFLATQGFTIAASTVRPVYLAGDTFELSITAKDAEGEPIAKDLTLSVLKQTTTAGRTAEVLVEKHELATDEKDGVARQTLKLAEGAPYVLRAEGTDRFGNPVSGQAVVTISDDNDSVRLRILADKHTFKVGDTARVQLHWREDPALALVTYQGARILDYQLVTLKKGANELAIPMTAKLAPNFELSVAVMTDRRDAKPEAAKDEDSAPKPVRRFHAASSPFAVERDLKVKLAVQPTADGKPPKPGDTVKVVVTTTDPQGKPVAAEVSLAVVEQALLSRFRSSLSPIDVFFRGAARQSAVRTTSSIMFNYRPGTRPINERLLAEADRLALAAEEGRRLSTLREGEQLGFGVGINNDAGLTGQITVDERDFGEEQIGASISFGLDPNGNPTLDLDLPYDQGTFGPGPGVVAPQGSVGRHVVSQQGVNNPYVLTPPTSQNRAVLRNGTDSQMNQVWHAIPQTGGFQSGRAGGQSVPAIGLYNGQARFPDSGNTQRVLGWEGAQATATDFYSRGYMVVPSRITDVKDGGTILLGGIRRLTGGDVVQMHNANGTWSNKNLGVLTLNAHGAQGVDAVLRQLVEQGNVLLPQLPPHETAYWNPAVVTDDKGQATVSMTLPERSTAWRLLVKGVTAETLAGEATDELAVKKDLFGQLKLPAALTDGDETQVVASVHNSVFEKGKIDVTLKTTIGDKSTSEKKTLDVTAKGIEELDFLTKIALPDAAAGGGGPQTEAVFELTVATADGEQKDVVRRVVPVRPYGMPVFAIAGGSATSDTTAFVKPSDKMPLDGPHLTVVIGPTVEQSLLDALFAPAPRCQIEAHRISSSGETAVSDLMAALALQELVAAGRDAASPQAESLDTRVRSSVSLLISMQNDDGGFSWTGRGGASNRYSTARAVWGLNLAKKSGYRVADDALNKAVTFLQTAITKIGVTDYDTKAVLLHALAVAGKGDFPLANQLHRNRQSLSTSGLVYLALAFAEMDRKQTAGELLAILAERNFAETAPKRLSSKNSLPWSHAQAELRALYALALEKVTPTHGRLSEQVDWLMAHRTGYRWAPDKATGPAMLVLCRWYARTQFAGEKYNLTVFVNDFKLKELAVDDETRTQSIDVPAEMLAAKGEQRVRFEIGGRGRFSYQCVLGGFVPADKLAGTTQDWRVTRYYEPAPIEWEGKPIERGFNLLQGSYSTFRNDLTQLPVASRGHVELDIHRDNIPTGTPDEHLEYLVVTEPLPAGTTVIEKSIKGGFERYELSPGQITFYIGSRRSVSNIHYDVHGYVPGTYRTVPTLVRNAYATDQIAVSKPKTLAVLPLGENSQDKYRLTPRELYELGQKRFDKGDLDQAAVHLEELLAKWNLEAKNYKEAARILLDVYLKQGPPAKVVQYFEIVIEKYPELEIPFAKLMKVGDAYHQLGEYERSYLVFRATVEGSFLRESQVAGFLEGRGEFLRSVDVMAALLREYPPEAYVASATYALAQQVYAKAPGAADDAKLREQKITRVDFIRRALAMLDRFLTEYSQDPAADQASFSLASGLLDLDLYEDAIAACQKYAQRYPKSDYLDSYWYITGFCHFARGEHEQALAMCRKVAEARRPNPQTGREEDSSNKWQAIYILGQICHSLDQAAEAIREYTRVEDRFVDAKQAIEYFAHKDIQLPEVTTFRLGEPVKLELAYRNVKACDTKVYRIDLMKFSLLKRNLGGITQINLAGIRPYHEATIELGDGKDYRDKTAELKLPLADEAAYLVVCRGENLHTSGLVLITPLELQVREDADSGRVRTSVRDAIAQKYIQDVHIKVIGSANDDFMSGETDLRGVFVADDIRGTTTVIAQAEKSRFAFHRGETSVGPVEEDNAAQPSPAAQPAAPSSGKQQLLDNLQRGNEAIQMEQLKNLKDVYDNRVKGGVQNFKW